MKAQNQIHMGLSGETMTAVGRQKVTIQLFRAVIELAVLQTMRIHVLVLRIVQLFHRPLPEDGGDREKKNRQAR